MKSLLPVFALPKNADKKLSVCPQQGTSVGWGIHLVEGWVTSRLWALFFSLFVLASLLFGVFWSTFKHDVQGAFGVSAWILSLAVLTIGTLQANFG